MLVGILALQGDVREHDAALDALGCATRHVKQPRDVAGLDALVLPGGESTTMSLLLKLTGLLEPLSEWTRAGQPTLGTCAGLVLLADDLVDGRADQRGLGGLPVTVQRNGYGRQQSSFEASVAAPTFGDPFDAVFIRAPRIVGLGSAVEVLGTSSHHGGDPEAVMVGHAKILACAFHPELSGDTRLHQRLVELAQA